MFETPLIPRTAPVVGDDVPWEEYRELDPVEIGELVHEKIIIDGRNVLDPGRWRDAGWTYRALGRR